MKTEIRNSTPHAIETGLYVAPDAWSYGQNLSESVYGMMGLRSNTASEVQETEVILPISKIEITGRKVDWSVDGGRIRARLTFWDEDEAETTTGAWIALGL